MLLQRITDTHDLFDSIKGMQRIQNQLNRLLSLGEVGSQEFPPANVWISENGAIVRAELPGFGPADVDISLVKDTLTIKGARELSSDCDADGQTCHRQERGHGQFTRSLQLPFGVDSERVQASFINGVLQINLPRAEEEKPRKITIKPA